MCVERTSRKPAAGGERHFFGGGVPIPPKDVLKLKSLQLMK